MNNDDGLMTAAPSPIRFADGTELRMSPLTDSDISELDNWIRKRFIWTVLDSLPADATDDQRERARMSAAREAMSITWMSGIGAGMMGTVDGMAQLCWQGCRHNHPDLTAAQLRNHMFNPANIDEVSAAFRDLNLPNPRKPGRNRGSRPGGGPSPKSTGR